MRNRRAIFSVLLTGVVLGLASLACEDDKPSEFDDQKLDAGNVPDRVEGFNVDGAQPPDAGAVVDCKPSLPTSFSPVWTAPAVANVCDDADITAYYDGCLDLTKNRNLKSKECIDFLAAKPSCTDCIEKKEIGPVLTYRERTYYVQNYPSCVALIQTKKGGTDACGKAFYNYEECRRVACDPCFDVKGSGFNDFVKCQDVSDNSGRCKELADTFDQNCRDKGYKDAAADSMGAPECFGTNASAEGRRDFFTKLIKISCGTAP